MFVVVVEFFKWGYGVDVLVEGSSIKKLILIVISY